MSEADQSLDSTQLMGEDDYGAGLQRRSSRQRRAREWGDDVAADWCGQKGSQSDDYSDEGESFNPPLKICSCVHPLQQLPIRQMLLTACTTWASQCVHPITSSPSSSR
jgi:hypothetical protein